MKKVFLLLGTASVALTGVAKGDFYLLQDNDSFKTELRFENLRKSGTPFDPESENNTESQVLKSATLKVVMNGSQSTGKGYVLIAIVQGSAKNDGKLFTVVITTEDWSQGTAEIFLSSSTGVPLKDVPAVKAFSDALMKPEVRGTVELTELQLSNAVVAANKTAYGVFAGEGKMPFGTHQIFDVTRVKPHLYTGVISVNKKDVAVSFEITDEVAINFTAAINRTTKAEKANVAQAVVA